MISPIKPISKNRCQKRPFLTTSIQKGTSHLENFPKKCPKMTKMTKMAIFGQKSVQKKLNPNNGREIWD